MTIRNLKPTISNPIEVVYTYMYIIISVVSSTWDWKFWCTLSVDGIDKVRRVTFGAFCRLKDLFVLHIQILCTWGPPRKWRRERQIIRLKSHFSSDGEIIHSVTNALEASLLDLQTVTGLVRAKVSTVESRYLELGFSNYANLEASIWIKNTFWLLSPAIIWRWGLFYKSKLPEVQIDLHFW